MLLCCFILECLHCVANWRATTARQGLEGPLMAWPCFSLLQTGTITIRSPTNRKNPNLLFIIRIPFLCCCLIVLATTSDTMVKSSGEHGHLCLVPDPSGKTSTLPPFQSDVDLEFFTYCFDCVAKYSFYVYLA